MKWRGIADEIYWQKKTIYTLSYKYHLTASIGVCIIHGNILCPDASVVHASGAEQLQANPHVAGPWHSPMEANPKGGN